MSGIVHTTDPGMATVTVTIIFIAPSPLDINKITVPDNGICTGDPATGEYYGDCNFYSP